MTKLLASSAADAALDYVATRATRLVLCSGIPLSATAAITTVSGGGSMLADLTLNAATQAAFAVDTTFTGERRLTIGGQTEVLGVESGTADHLALIDTAAGEILLLTELTETQPVLIGTIIATRSFSVTVSAPV
ncbi:MAG: hypothetical protein AAF479_01850 [Pseudomonadota bacterium]